MGYASNSSVRSSRETSNSEDCRQWPDHPRAVVDPTSDVTPSALSFRSQPHRVNESGVNVIVKEFPLPQHDPAWVVITGRLLRARSSSPSMLLNYCLFSTFYVFNCRKILINIEVKGHDMSRDAANDQPAIATIIDSLPDEVLGKLVRYATDLDDIQDTGRIFIQRFLQRNAIFTAKVREDNRITIPSAEVEKLGLEKDDLVQVVLTPIEELPDDLAENDEEVE